MSERSHEDVPGAQAPAAFSVEILNERHGQKALKYQEGGRVIRIWVEINPPKCALRPDRVDHWEPRGSAEPIDAPTQTKVIDNIRSALNLQGLELVVVGSVFRSALTPIFVNKGGYTVYKERHGSRHIMESLGPNFIILAALLEADEIASLHQAPPENPPKLRELDWCLCKGLVPLERIITIVG